MSEGWEAMLRTNTAGPPNQCLKSNSIMEIDSYVFDQQPAPMNDRLQCNRPTLLTIDGPRSSHTQNSPTTGQNLLQPEAPCFDQNFLSPESTPLFQGEGQKIEKHPMNSDSNPSPEQYQDTPMPKQNEFYSPDKTPTLGTEHKDMYLS